MKISLDKFNEFVLNKKKIELYLSMNTSITIGNRMLVFV